MPFRLRSVAAVGAAEAANQPINPRQLFKFERGSVTRIGRTDLDNVMPLALRNVV